MLVEICVLTHTQAAGGYLPPASLPGLMSAAHYQCQVSVRERAWHTFFHDGGGVQIIRSIKEKVTLSREGSAPSQVPLGLRGPPPEAVYSLHHVCYKALTAFLCNSAGFVGASAIADWIFNPVILNGFVICFCPLNYRDNPIFFLKASRRD